MTAPDVPHVPHPHASSATGVGAVFGKKVGPLPAWAYLVILVGAVYAYRTYKSRSAGTATTTTTPVDSSIAANGTGTTNTSGIGGVPADGAAATVVGTTNAQWARTAATNLIASGSDPIVVSSAFTRYLAGQPLSAAEQAIISVAVSRYGQPPEGVLPIIKAPVPTPPVVKPPTKAVPLPVKPPAQRPPTPSKPAAPAAKSAAASHKYTVHAGDNLTQISIHFYGNAGGVGKIAAANHIANPNLIHPGQVLTIPA